MRVGLTQEECRQISRADLFSDCRDIPLFYGFASHATVEKNKPWRHFVLINVPLLFFC